MSVAQNFTIYGNAVVKQLGSKKKFKILIKYHAIISAPLGNLGIITFQDKLCCIDFLSSKSEKELLRPQNDAAKSVANQLENYFCDPRYQFNLPLHLDISEFHLKVLRALQRIPSGATRTYGELAKQLNTGPRAIGMGCRLNPIPIVIPCHRIVAKTSIGGFSGQTKGSSLAIKQWLIDHEKQLRVEP